ncbi:MAG: HlyD family efflux transporter periplasmic adaptor subunit [Acidobacteriota bacterium]
MKARLADRFATTPRLWRRIAFAVGTVLFLAWSVAGGIAPAASNDSWARVERRDLVIGVEIEGELVASDSADIGPPQVESVWDFKISFMAPEGSEVQAGMPVLGFDTTRLQQELQEKKAAYDSTSKLLEKRVSDFEIERRDLNLSLAEAKAGLRRAELKLAVPENLVVRRELEQARIDQQLAQLQIENSQANLEHLAARSEAEVAALVELRDRAAARVAEIEHQIEAMTVKAPRAGTVIYKSRRGEKKKIGDSAWRDEKVLQIPDLERLLGEGTVAESDAGRLAVGQRLRLHLDAYPDHEYAAKVAKIHRTVQQKSLSNPSKVVRLGIELESTDTERMRPGMRFRGTIETRRLQGQLVVPLEAVFSQPQGAAVFVRTPLGKRLAYPTFGERSTDYFAIESGLDEGDRVLLRGIAEP